MIARREVSDEDDVLAGEYVLGVLSQSERLSVESRLKVDEAFAGRVALWEGDFSVLNVGYADLRAPNVFNRVEERLFPPPPRPKHRTFSFFQFFMGAATAAIMFLAVILTLPDPKLPQMTATLQAEAQALVFAASSDGQSVTLSQTAGPAPATGRTYELWLIAGDAAPVSLGVIGGRQTTHALPATLAPGMTLAVSLEPAGGSPTGTPTGPVLVTGVISL